ncbi:MAG TPA: FMN-binding protein [Candidatus Udaeobacter sp.]|nr:FMN-binding protein [Candidatus Udaeobacter sp.]
MSLSATFSEPTHAGGGRRPGSIPRRAAAVLCLLSMAAPAAGKVLLTGDEALGLAFPHSTITRHTIYLTQDELAQAAALAGEAIPTAVVNPYVATGDSAEAGTAYFDTHRVRTLPETLLIVVGGDGRVRRVEVLAFDEPSTYLAREPWLAQFEGQALDDQLAIKRDIRALAGATLTARATLAAVRRVLAVHRVIAPRLVAPAIPPAAPSGKDRP